MLLQRLIDFWHCYRFKTLLVFLDELYCFSNIWRFILTNKYFVWGSGLVRPHFPCD